jgi:hypothetical protein
MYRDVAEALQSIQQGPSDTRSQSYRLLVLRLVGRSVRRARGGVILKSTTTNGGLL